MRRVQQHITIRIYAHAKDYDCTSETKVMLENNGDLSLGRMQDELGDIHTCQVSLYSSDVGQIHNNELIDPANYKPMHLYKPGSIAAGDISRLKEAGDGYLRAV